MSKSHQAMRKVVKTVAGLGLGLCSVSAFATNGILPLGNGMTAHGFGGAGIANAGDAMAGTDNPALLAETGDQMAVGLTLFSPHRSADVWGQGYKDSDKNLFPIPSFGWTKILSPKMNTGILVTAMGGMNTTFTNDVLLNPPFGPPGDFGVDLSGLIVAPTLSYAPNKDVSYGASVLLGYEKMTTTLPSAFGLEDGTDTATGSGYKVGFSIHLDSTTQIGGFYQSEIKMGEMSKHCDTGVFSGAKTAGIECRVNLAPITGFGFNIGVTEKTKILFDIMDVAWSKVELFDQAFGWQDQEILKVGVEYKVNTNYAWRLGYNYGPSPLKSEYIATPGGFGGVMAPAVSEFHYTFGFTKKIGKNELVGYYAYIPENEQEDPGADGLGGAKVKMYQHALGLGFNWK